MVGSELCSHLWEDYKALVLLFRVRSSVLTIQSSVHSPQIDQQTHHCHVLRGFMFGQQLIPQYLAGLATPSHGIDIEVGKALLANLLRFIAVHEDFLVIIEHRLEKVILDILSPQGLSVIFLQVLHFVPLVARSLRPGRCGFLAFPRGAGLGRRWSLRCIISRGSHLLVFRHVVIVSR